MSDSLSPNQKEFRLQVHIIKKHAQYFPHVLMTAFPGRPGSAKDGQMKKLMGTRKGVTDILMWWSYSYPNWSLKWLAKMVEFCGFGFSLIHSGHVELKVDADVDPSQNKFMSAVCALKGNEAVVYSWREYYKLLCSWKIKPAYECTIFDEPDYRSDTQKKRDAFNWYKP